jgi:pimeloyl-ACP methyl ester carboxylesterase
VASPAPDLPPPLDGERILLEGSVGPISVYVAGPASRERAPMLLVHSVNAAASAYEVRPVFDHYRATRRVYAFDLPGFGLSDRRERPYTLRLMTDAVAQVTEEVRRGHPTAKIDLLGLSLGAEFAARAVVERPESYRSLTLVSPTGFNGRRRFRGPPGSSRENRIAHAVLAGRSWTPGLFRWLTAPSIVRYFLERTFGSKQIDEGLWAYCVRTARQPGAVHAPTAFLTGSLFSADVTSLYEALALPTLSVHGDRGDFVDYRGEDVVRGRPNWSFATLRTGALPWFERPDDFFSVHEAFLARAG